MPSQLRPNVLRMQPYSPGKPIAEVKRELGLERVVKLASNENPFGPSPKAIRAVQEAAAETHIYPDGAAYDLRQAISSKYGFPFENIVCGNGSDELIHLLGLILLGREFDEVIVGDPSFVRYDASAHLAPSKLIKVPLDGDYRHDLPAMARAVTENTKLLYIANPNNPTGTVVTKSEVDALLRDIPDTVTVVLDEAYYEFAMHLEDYPVSTDYVRAGANVVGLRTMSKTYGLAGVRVGWAFCPAPIADALNRAREPFNVNNLAQVAGIAALDDEDHLNKTVENNRLGVERLMGAFKAEGAKPCPSFANFVFADLGRPARPVFQALLERGVIVRPGDVLGAPNCLRVSVGTDEEIELFVEAFRSVMREAVAK